MLDRTFLLVSALALASPLSIAAQTKPQATPQTKPSEPRRIYIANDDHTDYMWSSDAETQDKALVDLLDFHLRLAAETADNPGPFKNRFNTDGTYWLWSYERRRSPAEFEHLMSKVKDGTIGVPLTTLVSTYGAQPVEAVLRGMYYGGRLERRYGIRLQLAEAMENQTLPLGLSSLFAGAGARYSWRGVCGCASKIANGDLGKRDHEIYWYAGHDGQRVLMKWYSLGKNNFGTYTEAGGPASAIASMEANPDFLQRYADAATGKPYSVFGLFGFGGDDLQRKTGTPPPPRDPAIPGLHQLPVSGFCDHFPKIAKDLTTPQRQVIVSNETDFFHDFESHYGPLLPTESLTYGNEWDLYSASMAETSARVKRAVEKLRAAEMMATLISLKTSGFPDRLNALRDQASISLGLYWEHDWTADGVVTRQARAAWQELQAAQIEAYVNTLYAESMVRLSGMIARPDKSNRFFVLNPLGWPRTDYADFAYAGPAEVHVRDLTTGKDVPAQVVKIAGARYVRILATDIPAAGYKVYEFASGPGDAPKDDAAVVSADGSTLENGAVKIVIEKDGAISSFIDKRHGNAEIANSIGDLRLNDIAPDSDAGESLKIENRGPVSVTLRARSDAGLDHTTAITLYRDSDRVDIRNEITANFSTPRYWSFSLKLDDPAVHTEEVGSINLNKLSTEGGDYATARARYDHVTVNHFADMVDGSGSKGITLSNPDLAFAKLGNSTPKLLDTATPQISMLAGGQVDGRYLGIQDQNGATHFLQRFALRAHAGYSPAAAMKFSLEHQNPLICGPMIGPENGTYPATTYSLLAVSNPNVFLWALKPAEEGIAKGVIARLWNISEASATTTLTFEPGIAAAKRTTHVETDLEDTPVTGGNAISVPSARQQLQTFRLLVPTPATMPRSAP